MFDAADLVALPGLAHSPDHDLSGTRGTPVGAAAGAAAAAAATASTTAVAGAGNGISIPEGTADVSKAARLDTRIAAHVVEACAMDGDNVALAMSDGNLCHAKLSPPTELTPMQEKRWPHWRSWPSRHGRVLQLKYSPVHGALVTLEVCMIQATPGYNNWL